MINKYKLMLLIVIAVIFLSNIGYSNDYNTGIFVQSINDIVESENTEFINLSDEANFWHYSGGYWQTNYYGNNFRLYDNELISLIDNRRKVFSIGEATIKYTIPLELQEYIDETGDSERIRFSIESEYLSYFLRPDEIFNKGLIKYRISKGEIEVKYTPLFNIRTKHNIQPINGMLNIAIPTINPKYGFPLFSIWNKDGTSLGNTNIGNIADVPQDHAFLDDRYSTISINTSHDIINPQGDLMLKDIGIWNTVPNKYTITEESTRDHRIGMGTFANGGATGMKFILPLRMYYPVLSEDEKEEEIVDPVESIKVIDNSTDDFNSEGVIKAMTPQVKQFNVTLGIPSSEEVYTEVKGKDYIANYAFEKVTGSKDFIVTVKRKYTEKWKVVDEVNSTEENIVYKNKSRSQTISKNYTVNRDYSYYKINHFENYTIQSATVISEVLPTREAELLPKNYTLPIIDLKDELNIVSEPSINNVVTLSDKTVGKNETPTSPSWSTEAEAAVGDYAVRNDKLVFNSEIIMDPSIHSSHAPVPKDLPLAKLIDEKTLRKEDIKINNQKRNGSYPSRGEIFYNKSFNFNGVSPSQMIKEISVNAVKVHTPIYSELLISNIGDAYNQQKSPDINDRAIILGMPTKFRYQTTGSHRNILGYGTRDYDQYILKKEIKFPFDVYYNASSREASKFLQKNTWMTVETLDTDIYVPIWVDEGFYTVDIRSTSINALESDTSIETLKNIDDAHYIIEDKKLVNVIGRLYGFKVRDIDDYPIWEEVFRKAANAYEFITGNNYPFGGKDEKGNILRTNPKYFLPIAPGSHPTYSNVGGIPLGYKIRFTVETIGNYLKNDKLLIRPSFSFINYEGQVNKNIKVWSKVKVDNKDYLIDLSSIETTLKDQILYKIDLGDPYITLTEDTFKDMSDHLGISLFELKKKVETIGFADEIQLTKYLRSYVGNTANKPASIHGLTIQRARQKWYGEYWLPSDTYVLNEDIDLIAYATENNGVDFTEDIFIKEGFLKVNFNIETLKDSQSLGENLIYKNSQANMYQLEGFNQEKEVNINGSIKTFSFEEGDVILYDLKRKRSDDYDSYGTH